MGVIPRIRQNNEGKPAGASLKYLTVGITVFHERHYFCTNLQANAKMKRLLVFFVAIVCAVASMAQNTDAMLFGDVKAKEGGQHLAHAVIQVKGTNLKTQCDATGHYKMANLPVGKQTVVATLTGYQPQEIEVMMTAGKGTGAYFELEKDPLELSQVVVTGTRTSHFVKDVPIRTEVLTSQALTKKNAQNLYEALEGVPGIRVEQQCQFCNFSEVRMQGLGAEHTQVLIDGEPVYSGLAGVYGLQQFGTNDIDRLEVVKGAGSALYGSSAVAGAINIISKEPTYEPTVSGDIQFGNYGFKRELQGLGIHALQQHRTECLRPAYADGCRGRDAGRTYPQRGETQGRSVRPCQRDDE